MATPATAQGPITPQHSDPAWQASYWNNTGLSGTPALTRTDTNIAFDWGSGSPASQVSADSSRRDGLATSMSLPALPVHRDQRRWHPGVGGRYDDPGQVVRPCVETHTAEVYLAAGHHLIQVDYFEQTGLATAKVQWALKGQVPATGNWKAEYFNNLTLSGAPALVRNEASVNYDWGSGSPQAGTINTDNFAARWTQRKPRCGTYTFKLTVDDGARLWVNGPLLDAS